MSDEDESMSEGFSASEDEWIPTKDARGGESSDDDDSDFEEVPLAAIADVGPSKKKAGEPKARSAAKQTASKKRAGLSLRAKLYNKYRPLPKTFSPPSSVSKNSPSASTSRTNPKNAKTPNESGGRHQTNDDDDDGSTSDGSIDNYLVNPDELDFQSSFFNADTKVIAGKSVTPVPEFDCNAGLGNLSDSESDGGENNDSGNFHKEDTKAFDFRDLLKKANSLERAKETIAKRAAADESSRKNGTPSKSLESKVDTMDVYSLLALGEKQNHRSHNEGEDEEDDDEEDDEDVARAAEKRDRDSSKGPSKLSKTKSTRVKRHTKTRPASTVVAGGDTDDSDFEEVADSTEYADTTANATDTSHVGNLEIHVELPSRQREKKTKTQLDIENALKRKLNREIKDRQLLMHKASFLCLLARSYVNNRLLNDTSLMQQALKLLPSKNAYPPERGTEIKYYQSLVTWFKSAITLKSQNLYADMKTGKSKSNLHHQLQRQIEKKKANCKQDMIYIFVILLRAMGLQCRLVVNMQPLPLKPPQSDLLSIKLKPDETEPAASKNSSKQKEKSQNKTGDNAAGTSATSKTAGTSKKHETQIKNAKEEKVPIKKKDFEDVTPQESAKDSAAKTKQKGINPKEGKLKESQDDRNSKSSEHPIKTSTQQSLTKGDKPNITQAATNQSPNNNDNPDRNKLSSNTAPLPKGKMMENIVTLDSLINSIKSYHTEKENVKKATGKTSGLSRLKRNKAMAETDEQCEKKSHNESPVAAVIPKIVAKEDKEQSTKSKNAPGLSRLRRSKTMAETEEQSVKKAQTELPGSSVIPQIVVKDQMKKSTAANQESTNTHNTRARSRSKSPKYQISPAFLESKLNKDKLLSILPASTNIKKNPARKSSSSTNKIKISTEFLNNTESTKRVLRSRQKTNEAADPQDTNSEKQPNSIHLQIPQMDGADDELPKSSKSSKHKQQKKKASVEDSEEEFEPSPIKRPKLAPSLAKVRDLRVLSTDNENESSCAKRNPTAGDMWVEVWSDVEEQWVCADLFKGKIHCVDLIRKSASSNLSYVYAFQNDLSLKDVTARYCTNWTTVVRKARIDKAWLDTAVEKYLGHRTMRDIKEDQDLRRIHEEKPMPTAIGDFKNHPFYALERHLLKFQAIYPPEAPALGYIRKEAIYSRDCVHTLHSREIWLKSARVVKLGEQPYKIVKARPKWDRITQTVIKDQPLEIFGYWQTEEYDPPTAENGIVPRNAYGNVELFKPTMLPKKCAHIQLPGLNRICKKLGVDCANAVVGFDFHQGSCHPTYDGFVVCEEFRDQVVAAWYQDEEEQKRKQEEKYEARVYGNWKKLIRGLLIRERLKLKYNF